MYFRFWYGTMKIWIDHQSRMALELSRKGAQALMIITIRQKKKIVQLQLTELERTYKQHPTTTDTLSQLINNWLTSKIPPSGKIQEVLKMAAKAAVNPEAEVGVIAKKTETRGRPKSEAVIRFVAQVATKLNKQQWVIVGIVEKHKEISRIELLKIMAEQITSKQTMEKIFAFYQKELINLGIISIGENHE